MFESITHQRKNYQNLYETLRARRCDTTSGRLIRLKPSGSMYKECKSVHVQARQQHQLGPTEFLLPSMGHAMLWQSGSPASFGSGLRLSYGSRWFEPEGIERDSRFHDDIWVCHGLPKPGYTRTPQNPSRSNRSSLLIIRRKMTILGYRTLPFHLRSRLHTAGSSRRGEHNRSVSTTTDTDGYGV